MLRLMGKRTRQERDERGMTLVETLVAMMLLTIVIGLATGALILVLGKNSNVTQASDAATQNQTAMELLSRVARQGVYPSGSSKTSTIIQSGSNTNTLIVTSRLSGTSSVSSQVSKFTFTLSGTTLYWQQADLVAGSCSTTCTYGTATTQKALIRGIRNNSGAAVCPTNGSTDGPFHYAYMDAATGLPVTTQDPTTRLGTIVYVTLNFYTQTQTGPQKPSCTLLSDFVELRNKT
jgi:prepilin-type N-terminal cleavage/methylation domain-containing protein